MWVYFGVRQVKTSEDGFIAVVTKSCQRVGTLHPTVDLFDLSRSFTSRSTSGPAGGGQPKTKSIICPTVCQRSSLKSVTGQEMTL